MTEKLKQFLDAISADERLTELAKTLDSQEKFIALAKEQGIELTKEDFGEAPAKHGEVDDDELEAVSGGGKCGCAIGGGGKGGGYDKPCGCAAFGVGFDVYGRSRCGCSFGGGGKKCTEYGGDLF